MKQIKKLLSFLLVLALVLGYVPAAVFAEGLSEEDKAEIVVSFELYDDKADQVALLFGPKAVEIEEGDNGKIIAERLLGAENVGISDTGYMESFTIDETEYSPATMELTYGSWLVYKNNSQDGVGPAEYVPADGDVYRFVLTSYDPVTYAMPTLGNDMDALYWAMAKSGADLTSANQLVQSAAPSQADIDAMAVSLSNPGEKHYIIIDQRTVQVDTTSYPYTYTETLSVDKLTAQAGEMVTVTVVAPEGLVLKEGSLKANGTALTKAEDGTYTFEMPDAHVSITAEFEADDSTKLLTAEFFLDEEGTKPVAMDPEFDKDVNEYKVDVLDQDLEEDLYFKATFNEGTTAQWQYYMEYSGYGFYSDGPEVVSGEIYGHSTANMLYPGMTNGMKHKIDVKSASGLLNEYFFTTTLYPTLASLAVNGEELPEFDYDTFEYEIEVPEGTEEITLCATPYDEDTYYVYIDGDDEDAAGADTTVAVTDGQEISVVVDDDNGTTKEYTLTVKIVAVPKLADLQFRFGSSATSALYVMEPVFDPNVFEYTIYVPDYTTNVYGFATLISGSEGTITAAYTNTSGAATTKTLTSGAASGVSFNGLVKSNDFTPGSDIVISINGTERYTVHVARQATLAAGTSGFSLKVDDASITLTPAYNRTVYEYDVNLPADAELSLTAKPTVASASLTVNGSEAQASTAMDIIPVWTDHGFDIVVEVSAEAVMSGVYTIHVHETPTELEIVASPAKIVYATGDEFDPAGMEVHAHYADGDTVNVPLEDLSFSPSGALRFSDTVITVSYNGATAEQPISFMAPFEGEGTEEDPFRIEDLEDMYTLDVYVENGESFAGTYLIMTDDIALDSAFNGVGFGNNFGGTASGYNANTCKGFSGDFNGDGHTLTVAAGGRAPFDLVRDGCVHDLNLYGEQIDDNGLVSTYIANGGSVELKNIVVKSGTKILKSGLIGGYGNKPLTISYCTVEEGVIVGYKKDQLWIGGIAGEFNGTIKNCSCDAEVYGVSFVGGIVADKGQSMQTFVVENCKFGGKVVASGEGFVLEDYPNNSMVKNFVPGSYAGGIVGAGYGGTQWGMNSAWSCPGVTIKNCEFTGTVEGSIAVGGILGGEGAQAQAWD
ncbi:MAG: cadherin-like beta sandwich domain-containing protein, partial [Firmicutes bacterium]|nr:cadherin-like beta sandwich domain-containing protein [Bacillota bacterium]